MTTEHPGGPGPESVTEDDEDAAEAEAAMNEPGDSIPLEDLEAEFGPLGPGSPALAAKLSAILGTMIVPIDGGFRVKETETHWIDVHQMLFNWRVVATPKASPLTWDRGWDYAGTGLDSLLRAVAAVALWDGADDTEPGGWIRSILAGMWGAPGA